MVKKLLAILMALVMIGALAACTPPAEPDPGATDPGTTPDPGTSTPEDEGPALEGVYKIGSYLQLTGGMNTAGATQGTQVLTMFADWVNKQGGFNGAEVQVVWYDTQASAEESVKAVTKLLEIDQVNAIVSSLASNEIQPVREMIDQAGLLHMNVGSSPATPDPAYTYFFRGAYNSNFGAPTYAKIIDEDIGAKRVAILHGQDDTSYANQQAVEDELLKRGIEVVEKQTYDLNDTDFTAQVGAIMAADPDTVYCVVNNEINLIIKQLRASGYNGIIFNKDSISSSAFEVAGQENCDYVISVAPYVTYLNKADCDVPSAMEFLNLWDETYNYAENPPQSWGLYSIWDSLMLLWEASKIAETNDSAAMRDAMESITDYDACGGIINFADYEDHESYHDLKAFVMIDGKYLDCANWFSSGGFDEYKTATGRDF